MDPQLRAKIGMGEAMLRRAESLEDAGSLEKAYEKYCKGPGAAALAYVARGAAEAAAAAAAAATEAAPAAATADTAGPSVDTDTELRAKVPKLRKDGGVKQSGLRQGDSIANANRWFIQNNY